jgi:hypothetical protein
LIYSKKPFIPSNRSSINGEVPNINIEQTFTILDKQSFTAREEITMNPEELVELGLVPHIFVSLTAENGAQVSCLLLSKPEYNTILRRILK